MPTMPKRNRKPMRTVKSAPKPPDHFGPRFVQLKNPKTGRYIKIDRWKGIIVSHKPTRGPYKDVPIVK